jgi:L-amino acid N-acyltransferase YncA
MLLEREKPLMIDIRRAASTDWEDIWPIFHEVVSRGDTYPFDPASDKDSAFQIWMLAPQATYVASEEGRILGTYYIKPNQPALGSHVCNAGYMVAASARGRGIGRAMCRHSLKEAAQLGFKAMQFNLVVATNIHAVKLWKDMGFETIGTLPAAFNHRKRGLVDAHVMYQLLKP